MRNIEPPTGRGSATTCLLILCRAGPASSKKRSAGALTSRS